MTIFLIANVTLLFCALGAIAVYIANSRLQTKRERALHTEFCVNIRDPQSRTTLSLFHILKGGRVIVPLQQRYTLLGISELELRYLLPVLLYFEGCVYAGDLETEAQTRGDEAPAEKGLWARSMLQAASHFGILNPALQHELDQLKHYYSAEDALMRGETPLSDRALYEINASRSHDILFIYHAALALLRRPIPESFLNSLRPWFTLGEVCDDICSYERDVQSGSFNTLSLLMQLHTPDRGLAECKRLCNQLIEHLHESLLNVEPRDVERFVGFLVDSTYGIPLELVAAAAKLVPRSILLTWIDNQLHTSVADCLRRLPPSLQV